MVQNPPAGVPQIAPYLLYEDVDGALQFLVRAFGFEEQGRMAGPDGSAIHAEARLGEGVVMMGRPSEEYKNPKHLGGTTQLVYVYVADVDQHCKTAKDAGAVITRELADQFYGDRTYGAEDPEGHQWSFAQHTRDIAPEDMHP